MLGFIPILVSHVKSPIFELNCPENCQKTQFFSIVLNRTIFWRPPHTPSGWSFFSILRSWAIRADSKICKNKEIKTELDKGGFWLSNFHMPTMMHYILRQKPKKVRFSPTSLTQMYLVICKVSWQQKIVSDVNFGSTLRNSKLICEDQKNIEAMHSRKSKQFFIKLENIEHIGFHVLNW